MQRHYFQHLIFMLACAAVAGRASAATSYTLITEPDQGITPIYNFIMSAQHTLDMTMYELTDTTAEQDLAAVAASGVTVRVILDYNLEKSNNQAAYTYLNAHGVQCHWAYTTYAATHQKTITIDSAYSNAQTAIMTLNLTSQYYSTSRDFAIIENDPNDIAAIETTFQADFNSSPITPPDGDDLVWSPTNSQSTMLALINGAQHTLLVENEEMSDTNIVNALVSAAKRGVNVQIIMNAGTYTSEWAEITAAGGNVSVYPATTNGLYIHAKIIVADYGYSAGQFFQGSENFSNASLTENRELGMIINNLPIMASLAGTLTADFNGGQPQSGTPAEFDLTPGETTLSIAAGSTGTVTVTEAPFQNFGSIVTLSAFGLPSSVTASFSPSNISGGAGSSTMTLTVGSGVAAGSYLIGILGTAGSLTNSTGVYLTVTAGMPGFSLSVNPTSLSIQQGSAGNSTITSTAVGGFSSTVSLGASGLPSGVTASFSPSSIADGSGTSTLTLTASASAATGTATVTLTGTGNGVTESTQVNVTITTASSPNFSLSASPTAVSITTGSSGTSTITAKSTGGFASSIALSASGLPSGITASFMPSSIAGGAGASTLTLTAASTAATGTASVLITGTGGGVTATTTVSLTVSSGGGPVQLIVDGSFQSATKSGLTAPGWTGTTNKSGHNLIIVNGSYGYNGDKNYGQLGGVDNAIDELAQTITIPAGSTSTPLTFWLSIYTTESNSNGKAYDYLYVEIHNSSGGLLATLLTLSNLNGTHDQHIAYFQPHTVDLSAYAGQTVELVFHATNDNEDATTFYIDGVSVTAN